MLLLHLITLIFKVRDYHRKYFEAGTNTRDFMIVAHGHFSRVFISRWFGFPLCLGELQWKA
jgi:probable phosphoglycerate mutase